MKRIIFIFILLIATITRAHRYWVTPLSDETADEIAWTWLGSSLLQQGRPISWSYFDAYQPDYVYQKGVTKAPLVSPDLDHPPLFSLLPGFVHTLTGGGFEIPSRKVIRLPMVVLGVVNVGLLYLASKSFFSPRWQLIAAAIYATVPIFVLGSRLVVAENLLISCYLILIILISKWSQFEKSKPKWIQLAVIGVSVAAVLAKMAGFVVPLSVFVLGLIERDRQLLKLGTVAIGLGIGALLGYAAIYNLPLFLAVQLSQGGRLIGLTTIFYRFFIHPTIAQLVYFDGWLVLGLIALLVMIFAKPLLEKKTATQWKVVQILSLGTILFIVLSSGEFTYHGWYSYPLIPLFVLAMTWLVKKIWRDKNSLGVLMIWLLLLPTISVAVTQLGWSLGSQSTRVLYLLGGVPLLFQFLRMHKLRQTAVIILGTMVLISNLVAVFSVSETSLRAYHNYYFFQLQQ